MCGLRPGWLSLLGWQLASLLLTATSVCSQRLAEIGVHAPTAQSFVNYALLSLHALPLWWRQRRRRCPRGLRSASSVQCISGEPTQ